MDRVFTYGTLQVPEVMEAVTGRAFPSEAAVLDGYARFIVRRQAYPGILAAPGAATPGRVYADVDAGSLRRLDRFEGDLYERRRVSVSVAGGECLAAETYVVPATRRHCLSAEPWDIERFIAEELLTFVEQCRRFQRHGAS
jgi:gamma-glutamylcyclotransferase (GGCT)/AIG2-like uncharacterized protein YtfP